MISSNFQEEMDGTFPLDTAEGKERIKEKKRKKGQKIFN